MEYFQAAAIELIQKSVNWHDLHLHPLKQDGSSRSYFRISQTPNESSSYILMKLIGEDASRLLENKYDWVTMQRYLCSQDFNTPNIVTVLPQIGVIIAEDFGDQTLENITFLENRAEISGYYRKAIQIIAGFCSLEPSANLLWTSRKFDEEKLYSELDFFIRHYLIPTQLSSPAEISDILNDFKSISKMLASHSNYFCHRDYHSRNLMIKNGQIGIIDFQDARLGSAVYDLVSLVFDSYVNLEPSFRYELLEFGLNTIENSVGKSLHDLWPIVLLQRQMKAIGSFGFLTLSVKRGDYLSYVPSAIKILEGESEKFARWPNIQKLIRVISHASPCRLTF